MEQFIKKKIFILVDCNSFYCSCERLFRPDLKNIPVGVLSNNDGCFVSRTSELKALGVKMGDPYFKVKDLCKKNKVAVFSANFSLYSNISDRVMRTLATFTPELEVYSVDEAFLCLDGFTNINLLEYCKKIKHRVERDTGIPVSVGASYSKTLAKAANHIAKKSKKSKGVVVLTNERLIGIALEQMKIEHVWGIGSASSAKLKYLGINTAKDLRDYQNKNHIRKVLTIVGLQTKEELEGKPCFQLETVPAKKKEIMCSRTFGTSLIDITPLRESVANYITNAAEKLRKQDSTCSRVEVFARTSPFKNAPQYYAFETVIISGKTENTLRLIRYALSALESMFKQGYEYKKAGIRLSGLVDNNQSQLSLIEENDSTKSEKLMAVIDKINRLYGTTIIKSAACGTDNKSWKMNRNFKSPRYVTGYTELPKVF